MTSWQPIVETALCSAERRRLGRHSVPSRRCRGAKRVACIFVETRHVSIVPGLNGLVVLREGLMARLSSFGGTPVVMSRQCLYELHAAFCKIRTSGSTTKKSNAGVLDIVRLALLYDSRTKRGVGAYLVQKHFGTYNVSTNYTITRAFHLTLSEQVTTVRLLYISVSEWKTYVLHPLTSNFLLISVRTA
jgi:hypothetical protein